MTLVVEDFDAISIKNSSVQMHNADGTKEDGKKFGSLGNVEGTTTLRELIKRLERVEVKKRMKPEKMDLTVSAHIKVEVMREIFGLSNEGLKPGVYKYSNVAKGKEFTFTSDVIDEFEDVTKLVAFPRCTSAEGFKFSVENAADEVAEMEINITAYPDEQGNIMYDAFIAELDEADAETISSQWHTQFDYSLVELVPAV